MAELYQGFIEVNSNYKNKHSLLSTMTNILTKEWPISLNTFYNKIVLKDYGEYFLFHLYGKDPGESTEDYVPECRDIEIMIPLDYSLNEAMEAIKYRLENECSNIRTRMRLIEEERKVEKALSLWSESSYFDDDFPKHGDILKDLEFRSHRFERACENITKRIR